MYSTQSNLPRNCARQDLQQVPKYEIVGLITMISLAEKQVER